MALVALIGAMSWSVSADDFFPPCWRNQAQTTFQQWTFDDNDNPAAPENVNNPYGAPSAAINFQPAFGGWNATLPGFGPRMGIWDLGGNNRDITLTIPNGPSASAYKYVSVQVTEFVAPGFYDPVIVSLSPAATLVRTTAHTNAADVLPLGVWRVVNTVWRLSSCPSSETVTLTSQNNGALIDQIVVDTLCLDIPCPTDITVNSNGGDDALAGDCQANVTWSLPNTTCPIASASCDHASGSSFPVGMTTVVCTITDIEGRPTTCTFNVTVTDNEPPVANCPGNVTVTSSAGADALAGDCQAKVNYVIPAASDNCPGATTVCTPPSGSLFPVGTTTVMCTATDASLNTSTTPCSFMVTVVDDEPPVANCPANISVNSNAGADALAGDCQAKVNYVIPAPSDNCPGASTVCVPASGSFFPVGTTTVTCTATDAGANSSTCNFMVTVVDNEPPVANCPANISVNSNAGADALAGDCQAKVNYVIPAASDNCPGATTVCVPASGSFFPVGTTTVTCTATDVGLNASAPCTFTVTVVDNEPPVANCPANIMVNSDAGADALAGDCQAKVNYVIPPATDNCPAVPTTVCTPPSGSFFPVGTTTVTCTATDGAGNSSAPCTFTVKVIDNEPPTANCPANLTVNSNGGADALAGDCQAKVNYVIPAGTDNCPVVATACSPPPNSFFPVGTTTVNCAATDASGNHSTSCSFTITVVDNEPPVLNCPANITVNSTDGADALAGDCQAKVNYVITPATDNCPGVTTTVCTPASGSFFPVGSTTVNCTAMDAIGNSAPCTFTVTVVDNEPPVPHCPANISTAPAPGHNDAVVTFTATVTDNCPGATINCTPASGSTFPLGPTTVNCTATDASANTGLCSFTVTVSAGADLSITKVAMPNPVPGGGIVTYTITVSNAGPATATGVVVTDTLSSNQVLVSVADSVNGSAQNCPTPGPIAWWRAEGNANDAADSHHGTLQNGATFATGKVGQAFNLDGVNDYISVPDSPSLHVASLTMEGWFNFADTNDFHILVAKPLGTGFFDSFVLVQVFNQLHGAVEDTDGNINALIYQLNPVLGQWYHIAYTFNSGTGNQEMYINGTLVLSGFTPKQIAYDSHPLLIGADTDFDMPPSLFFPGLIDDVAIYDYPLSGSQIQGIFNAGSAGKCATPRSVALGSLPVGATATATLHAVPSTSNCTGMLTNVASVTANETDPNLANNKATNKVAIMDLTPPVVACPADIVTSAASGQCSRNVSYTTPVATDNCSAATVVCAPASNSNFPSGTNTVTCTATDGSGNMASCTFKVVVNGATDLLVTMTTSLNTVGEGSNLTYTVTVNNTGPCAATGVILSNFLSPGQVLISVTDTVNGAAIDCPQPGPVAWWRAEGDARDVADGHDGTLVNGASFAAGEVGQAFNLFGTDEYVSVPDSPGLRPVNLTIEGWFLFNDTNGLRVLVAKPLGSALLDSYVIVLVNGSLHCAVEDNAGHDNPLTYPLNPALGVWYHIAYAFNDAANTQALYVNGVQVLTGTTLKSIAYDSHPLLIGADIDNDAPPSFFLAGFVDELSLYNRTLSATEVQNIYNTGSAGKCALPRIISLGTLANNATATAKLTVVPSTCSGSISNVATVFASVSDTQPNNNSAIGKATVIDKTAPVILCPPTMLVSADPGHCNKTNVTFTVTATDNCPGPTVTCNPLSGSTFPKGTNTVNCTATDGGGNTASCSFKIVVLDTDPPLLTCPDITFASDAGQCSKTNVTYSLMATDLCSSVTVVCTPPSGSTFLAGTNMVNCTAADTNGNTANCSFKVVITATSDLVVMVTASPSSVTQGSNLTYTVMVSNAGPCVAMGVTLSNSLSAGQLPVALGSTVYCPYPGPVTWWRAEGNALDAADSNHGTLVNGTTFAAGEVGQAFSLDGNNDYISIPDSPSLRPVNLTVEGWFNFGNPNSLGAMVGKPLGSGFFNSFALLHELGDIHALVADNSGFTPLVFSLNPTPGLWYHIAYTFDDVLDTHRLYINGVQVASGAVTRTIGYDSHSVLIGADSDFNNPPGLFFNGLIDELAIYNRALSPAEVQGIYNNGSLGRCVTPPSTISLGNLASGTKVTVTLSVVPLICGGPVTNVATVRLSGLDSNLANNSATGTALVIDTSVPVIVCPGDLTMSSDAGTCNKSNVTFAVTGSASCPGTIVVCNPTNGSTFPKGTNMVSCVATNTGGQASQCSFKIIIEDLAAPIITVSSLTNWYPTLEAASNAVVAAVTLQDGCDPHPTATFETSGSGCNSVVKVTAHDARGNIATLDVPVRVDNAGPVLTGCPGNLLVDCLSNVPPAAPVTAVDDCDGAVAVSLNETQSQPGSSCSNIVTRIWKATDLCGHTNTCTQIITVRDTTPPVMVCPTNVTVECFANVPATNFAGGSAIDNCGPAVASFVQDVRQTNGCVITILRTYRGTDACNNTNFCVQTITVQDTTPPTITCPTNIIVDCTAAMDPGATGSPTATDNCDPAPLLSHTDSETPGICPVGKVIQRTWVATDRCGNTNSCIQIITVRVTTPPNIICPPDVTVACNADIDPNILGMATATDACDALTPTIAFSDSVIGGPCPIPRVITRKWFATDHCGNTTNCIQIIMATDNCLCGPAPTNAVAWWKAEGNANDSVDSNNGTLQNGATFGAGQVGQAFSLDGSNDYITVPDAPSLRPVNLSIEGWFNFTVTNSLRTLVSKSVGNNSRNSFMLWLEDGVLRGLADNGGGGTTILSYSGFNPVPGQWYHIAYTFQDSANLHTLYVNGVMVASGATSETINYDNGAVVLGADINNGSPSAFFGGKMDEVAIYSRALGAFEIQGIFNAGTQGKDATPPTLTCPPNLTAQCDTFTNLTVTGRATASDACDPHPIITFTDTVVGGICQTSMVVTRTWKATDCHGNMATCPQIITVTVVAGTPPSLACPPNLTVECGSDITPSGTGTASGSAVCGPVTITSTDTVTPGTHCVTDHIVKTIVRRWVATDFCGNSTNCLQTITVRDTTSPTIACPDDLVVNTDPGECTATAQYIPAVTDSCDPNPSVVCVPATGSTLPIGLTTVFCTASDACGNISMCSFSVTVNELDPSPVLSIRRQGINVVICWPAGCPDYQLESKPFLNSVTPWINVPNAPILSGDKFCVTLPIGNANLFFRLRKL
jgi:uncharacterized repeat protein (TIGR01451 family)